MIGLPLTQSRHRLRIAAFETLWLCAGVRPHSPRMLAALMIGHHFSISDF